MKAGIGCAALAFTAALASSVALAGASTPGVSATHNGRSAYALAVSETLYSQNDNDTGVGVVSQNFDSANDSFDSQGADDFTVPAGRTWKITGIVVTGRYFGGFGQSGPAASETVTFYKNAHGLPGLTKNTQVVTGTDNGTGSFVIPLTRFGLKGGSNGKRFWVSVQANMDFFPGGKWAWETHPAQNDLSSMWQNPSDGWGIGCTHWMPTTTCLAGGEGPDNMFALSGVPMAS